MILVTFFAPCMEGNSIGIISEAGCPGIADPGADIVRYSSSKRIKSYPLSRSFFTFISNDGKRAQWAKFCFQWLFTY